MKKNITVKYLEFILESQAKKLRNYVDFSTFFDWFNENRPKIANILECDVDDIVTEEELLKQSSDLINKIINPQTRGNTGTPNTSGFEKFQPLKSKIIHDILHNLYNVTEKEFDKSESALEYSESEIVEEIEVLAIEESYMKYFNIDYVRPDFINQNINRLASFLMMSILIDDSQRILDILDGKVEAYIEVYGNKYPVKGTPFENFFKVFSKIPINPLSTSDGYVETSEDFLNFLRAIYHYSDLIDSESGDRAEFPYGNFLGFKSYEDLTDQEIIDMLERNSHTVFKKNEIDVYISDIYDVLNNSVGYAIEDSAIVIEELQKFEDGDEVEQYLLSRSEVIDIYHEGDLEPKEFDSDSDIADYTLNFLIDELGENTFSAILRRYFRYDDLLVNAVNLDKDSNYYTSISNNFKDKKSLSKGIFTENGRKLIEILETFKGFVIKNSKDIIKVGKIKNKLTSKDRDFLINFDRGELLEMLEGEHNLVEYFMSLSKFDFETYFRLLENLKSDTIVKSLISLPNVENKEQVDKYKEFHLMANDMFLTDKVKKLYELYKHNLYSFIEKYLEDFGDNDILENGFGDDLTVEDVKKVIVEFENYINPYIDKNHISIIAKVWKPENDWVHVNSGFIASKVKEIINRLMVKVDF